MDPLPVVCVGAGLVAGAVLAWAIRGRQLSRLQQTHDAQRQGFEAEATSRRVKIETLKVDGESVRGELEKSQQAIGETQAARSREQDTAGQQITSAEARIGELTGELGQLREQLARTRGEIELQSQAGRDLEDQLATSQQQSTELTEQLQKQQQQLAELRLQRDQLVARLDTSEGTSKDHQQQQRRWRISTFFED